MMHLQSNNLAIVFFHYTSKILPGIFISIKKWFSFYLRGDSTRTLSSAMHLSSTDMV